MENTQVELDAAASIQKIGRKVNRQHPRTELDQQAYELSQHITKALSKTEASCEDLMWEWTQDHLWGSRVKRQIPQFKELYDFCVENGHKSHKTAIWYGDMDVGVWYVPLKKGDHRKILILRNICTCRDDNTFVFIHDNFMDKYPEEYDDGLYEKFLSTNVWDRQQMEKRWNFGDFRDVKRPSLATLKRFGYKSFGYEDGNNKCHNFLYKGIDGKVDKSTWSTSNAKQALMELDFAYNNIVFQKSGFLL